MSKCRLCQSQKLKVFLPGGQFQLLKCLSCDIVFTDPFPSKKSLGTINKKKYGQKDVWQGYSSRLAPLLKEAEEVVKEIKAFKKSGCLLDIGCGFGLLLKSAQEQGFEVLGVEKEQKAVEMAAKKWGLPVIKGEFPEVKLECDSFDVVTCLDVLEHVKNPQNFLSSLHRILKKDGLLVVQAPNIESMMAKITGQRWNWLLLPSHLWHFSPHTFKTLVETHGFKTLTLKTLDDLSEFNFNLIDLLGIKKNNLLSRIIWKTLRIGFFGLAPLSFIWSKLGRGGLIRIYAQKKE